MDDIKAKVDEYWKLILILIVSACFLLILLFNLLNQNSESPEIDPYESLFNEIEATVIEEENLTTEENVIFEPIIIMVDIKGAVSNPGVYKMEDGQRIIELIEKAGGLLEDAESKAINFAQKVEDQMVVYIPKVGEEDIKIIESPVNETTTSTDTKININEADASLLMTLNGIGSSKAENILQYREEKGYFKTIEEIKNVSGIGEATFNQLKESITVSN